MKKKTGPQPNRKPKASPKPKAAANSKAAPKPKLSLKTVAGQRAYIELHQSILAAWAKQGYELRGRGYISKFDPKLRERDYVINDELVYSTPADWCLTFGSDWLDGGLTTIIKDYDPTKEFLVVFWSETRDYDLVWDSHLFKLTPAPL